MSIYSIFCGNGNEMNIDFSTAILMLSTITDYKSIDTTKPDLPAIDNRTNEVPRKILGSGLPRIMR